MQPGNPRRERGAGQTVKFSMSGTASPASPAQRAQPAQPLRRRSRPGQPAPQRATQHAYHDQLELQDQVDPDQEQDQDQEACCLGAGGSKRQAAGGRGHQHRVEAVNAAWRDREAADKHDLVAYAPSQAAAAARRQRLIQDDFQDQINQEQIHCCPGAAVVQQPDKWCTVEYVSMQHRCTLRIHQRICTGCNNAVPVSPVPHGCWGNTPKEPSIWFDQTLLQAYSPAMAHAMSMLGRTLASLLSHLCMLTLSVFCTGYTEMIHTVHHPYTLHPARLPIRVDALSNAYFSYQAAAHGATTLTALGCSRLPNGPFADCPLCVTLPGAPQQHGSNKFFHLCSTWVSHLFPPVCTPTHTSPCHAHCPCAGLCAPTPYPVAFSIDAVQKFCHFKSAGLASQAIQPRISTYVDIGLDGLDGVVQRRHAAGQLNLAYSMAGGDLGVDHSCSAQLSCSRPTAAKAAARGIDVFGVVGATCCHGVPARGLFCDMRTPEQFTYYLLLLERALLHVTSCHIYVDFACRLKKTWKNYVGVHGLRPAWADVELWVPWMHAASHDQPCQMENNARFQEGAAWRVGEQAEQSWAGLKDMSPLVKYMTHAHRTDAMQIVLAGIAFDKQANMVDFLIGKHADMLKKKADLVMQLAELKTKAAAAGITDGEDAAAQYKAQHQRTKTIAANPDWSAEYVLLKLTTQAFRYMSGQVLLVDTCSDSLPMPTPEMADLLTDGKKVTQLGAMEEKVLMLGMTHRVNNQSGSWCSPDVAGSVHTLGLARLKAAKMASLQSMVWQAVLLVTQLETQQKEWGVADKDTRALARQSQAKMKQAHQLVDQLALWEVLGTTQHPNQVRVTSSQLRSMVRGEPAPWERESQTSQEGKVLFFGRQFFHLLSDSQRCLEQLALLKLERARLNAWLHFILRASRAAYAAAQAGEGAQAGGRQFYLQQHITHYEGMLAQLQKLLWA
ncbi:hypothetical protein QJQ45_016586 [Haematococcus lacustris]|nr:hypothetical protein QJQ45_016586 [Haematococcus lacustris]